MGSEEHSIWDGQTYEPMNMEQKQSLGEALGEKAVEQTCFGIYTAALFLNCPSECFEEPFYRMDSQLPEMLHKTRQHFQRVASQQSAYLRIYTCSHTSGTAKESNLGFSISPKDIQTCRLH